MPFPALLDDYDLEQLFDEGCGVLALERLIRTTVRAVLRSDNFTEDTVQEVVLEIWRTRERFDEQKGNLTQWVATVARRRAIDKLRAEQGRSYNNESGSEELLVNLCGSSGASADRLTLVLDRRRVLEAMATLDERHRLALFHSFYLGHTYRDVAGMLDLPEGTVKRQVRDGLRKLKVALAFER